MMCHCGRHERRLPLVHHHFVDPTGCYLCLCRSCRLVVAFNVLPQGLAGRMLLSKVSVGRNAASIVRGRRRGWELYSIGISHLCWWRRRHFILVRRVGRLDDHLNIGIAFEKVKLV